MARGALLGVGGFGGEGLAEGEAFGRPPARGIVSRSQADEDRLRASPFGQEPGPALWAGRALE